MTLNQNIKNQIFFHLCTQTHNQSVFWQEIWSELESLLVHILCIKKKKKLNSFKKRKLNFHIFIQLNF